MALLSGQKEIKFDVRTDHLFKVVQRVLTTQPSLG